MRMMCGKMLCNGIPNGLLKDRTGVEDIENRGETKLQWFGLLEWMNKTNLVKIEREERVPGHKKRGKPNRSWNEMVREDMKERLVHQ